MVGRTTPQIRFVCLSGRRKVSEAQGHPRSIRSGWTEELLAWLTHAEVQTQNSAGGRTQ